MSLTRFKKNSLKDKHLAAEKAVIVTEEPKAKSKVDKIKRTKK